MAVPLLGSVVHVIRWRADGEVTFHGPLSRRLEDAGAKLAVRMSREVTHVIFVQKALASPHEKKLEEDKLRDIYDKIEKVKQVVASYAVLISSMHSCAPLSEPSPVLPSSTPP